MRPHKLQATGYKLLLLIGPTSSGKSELAIKLAKRFNGEIISCDSRQIYKGMDLGTGKVNGKWHKLPFAIHPDPEQSGGEGSLKLKRWVFLYKTIPHHLIDFVNPKQQYSVALFLRDAKKIIADISGRGKLPILCGGTMHWIDAIVFNQTLPDVKPNPKLRARFKKQSADALFKRLIKLDPARASTIDKFNKRRLIRALEIAIVTGNPVPIFHRNLQLATCNYIPLWLGIKLPQKTLYQKIDARLKQRLKAGMIKETARLHRGLAPSPLPRPVACRFIGSASRTRIYAPKGQRGGSPGLSWRRMESFGLEYRFLSLFLQNKISYNEMLTQLAYAIKHYSKRQITWWKKNKKIIWIKPNTKTAVSLTKKFLE